MHAARIGFLGIGNMGQCCLHGLIQQGYATQALWAYDRKKNNSDKFPTIHHASSMQDLMHNIDTLVLAVKPKDCLSALEALAAVVTDLDTPSLFISIVAGLSVEQISAYLPTLPIIRAMPNTPACVQAGISALYAPPNTLPMHKQIAETIFSALGHMVWLDTEAAIHIATALSGSGPAYVFYFMEALINSAIALGLDPILAEKLTLQTVLGAAKMAVMPDQPALSTLREQVTSPGGTTQAAIQVLNNNHFEDLIHTALKAAWQRSQDLSHPLGKTIQS